MSAQQETIGFIGQGYIGKNYADDFKHRGYSIVRYSLEPQYHGNKDKIKECDIVFVAVPTPTTPNGFDASIVENALALVGKGKIAVIKSTILPGTTVKLQKTYPDIILLYAPEFLSEATAAQDAAQPFSNIIGMALQDATHQEAATRVHSILPEAPYVSTCSSIEAEIIKYTHNGSGYTQIVFFNMMYDLARSLGADWQKVQEAIQHDPLVSNRYARPLHKTGRGAGGHCFIKDFAALRELYEKTLPADTNAQAALRAFEQKNIDLLKSTNKDLDLLKGVYGEKLP